MDIPGCGHNESTVNCYNTSETVSDAYVLWLLNEEQFHINFPCMIFYVCAIILGSFGNSLVIYMFGFRFKRNTVHFFIMWLAIYDITSCTLLIYETLDKRLPMYSGQLPAICKIVRCLEVAANAGSSLLLVCIAFDRYYKVCKPLKRFSMRRAKHIIIGIFITITVVSWPMLFFHGSETVPTPFDGISGEDCADDDNYSHSVLPSIYFICLFVSILSVLVILCVLYVIIFVAIIRWKNRRIGESMKRKLGHRNSRIESTSSAAEDPVYAIQLRDKLKDSPDTQDQQIKDQGSDASDAPVANDWGINDIPDSCSEVQNRSTFTSVHMDSIKELGTVFSNEITIEKKNSVPRKSGDQFVIDSSVKYKSAENKLKLKLKLEINSSSGPKRLRRSRSNSSRSTARISATTITFALVTLLYIISYIPTIAVEMLNATGALELENLSIMARKALVWANSSYFANGALNPIIYGLFNRAFRKELSFIFKGS